ncbi:hypothetical protein [Paenibacillus sp. FSL K6-1230]|uniref:hypothetical protein n=1 Tax=Paenibacillus sp. FSL K6-1230 TaxID=2921603 RepID=UPI0030F7870F
MNKEERRQVINLNSFELERVYERIKAYEYGEEFLIRLFESYMCYLNNLSISSIIVSSEAMFRVLCDRVKRIAVEQKVNITISKNTVMYSELIEDPFSLSDKFTFNNLITYLEKQKVYNKDVIDNLKKVKNLRNKVTHGTLPLITEWDPDDPRSREEILNLLRGVSEIPEAYKISLRSGPVYFDCREYDLSLRSLDPASKIAVIQLVYIREILMSIFSDEMPIV